MSFGNLVAEHQRLLILQMLEQDAGYSHNEIVLQAGLDSLGHSISIAALHGMMDWLSDAGLLIVTDSAVGKVAKITARGVDVAKGRTIVSGVARPQPRV